MHDEIGSSKKVVGYSTGLISSFLCRRCHCAGRRRRGRAAAVRDGRGSRGVRHRAGGVGVRRGGAAGVPGVGVPLHPPRAHMPGARPPRQVVPALAVAAARVLAAQVRSRYKTLFSSLAGAGRLSRLVHSVGDLSSSVACVGSRRILCALLFSRQPVGRGPALRCNRL
jgi:hypothetical protein